MTYDMIDRTKMLGKNLMDLSKRFTANDLAHLQFRQKDLHRRVQILLERRKDTQPTSSIERILMAEIAVLEGDCQV